MNNRPATTRLLGALLLMGLTGAMAACNALIGLDPGHLESSSSGSTASGIGGGTAVSASAEVSTGSTTPGSSTGGGGTSSSASSGSASSGSASSGSTSSTGSGGPTCPGPVTNCSNDPAWAHWKPEPGPGCTDRFTATKDSVFDKVTGLTWQRTGPAIIQSWSNAVTFCDNLGNSGGFKWRLPTRIELVSIADFSRSPPTIDPVAFPNTTAEGFWTSSSYAGDSSKAWFVAFGNFSAYPGAVKYDEKIHSYYVRCVH